MISISERRSPTEMSRVLRREHDLSVLNNDRHIGSTFYNRRRFFIEKLAKHLIMEDAFFLKEKLHNTQNCTTLLVYFHWMDNCIISSHFIMLQIRWTSSTKQWHPLSLSLSPSLSSLFLLKIITWIFLIHHGFLPPLVVVVFCVGWKLGKWIGWTAAGPPPPPPPRTD